MNNKIIILNGVGGSGKDTVVDLVNEMLDGYKIYNLSTVDLVKEIAEQMWWDGGKDPKSREFLSKLKDLWTVYNNGPYSYIRLKVQSIDRVHRTDIWKDVPYLIFIHSREIPEIKNFVSDLNAKTLLIRRDVTVENPTHADDQEQVYNYKYDYTINNCRSLGDLRHEVIFFLQWLLRG